MKRTAEMRRLEYFRTLVRKLRGRNSLAAVLAATVIALSIVSRPRSVAPLDGIDALIDSAGGLHFRTVAPRLSAAFAYRPLRTVTRGYEPVGSEAWSIAGAAAGVKKRADAEPSASNLQTLGVSYLLFGYVDDAVQTLERATGSGGSAAVLSDLAAAYYVQGMKQGRADDIARGLELSDAALAVSPRSMSAQFNRALTLEALENRPSALAAWQRYLQLDPSSEWAVEARQHIDRLSVPPPSSAWHSLETRLRRLSAADLKEVGSIAERFPLRSRRTVENELLPRWARAHAQHDEHDERIVLEAVEIMGAALASRFADPTLVETARTISAAMAVGNEERLAALTRGYLAYAAARSVADEDTDEARSLFRRAWTSLREAGSPSAYSAGMYAAAKAYEGRDYAEALRLVAAMKSDATLARYAPLAGQVDWIEGMVLLASGRPYESLQRYREALRAFQRSGEVESIAAVDGLLAENLQSLGDDDEAWRYRLQALPVILEYGDERRQQVAFNEAAEAAMEQNRLSAALEYQMASVALTGRGSNDHMAAYSYLGRALILGRKGQADAGLADIGRARQCSARVGDAVIRKTTTADIDMAEAMLRQGTSPAAAVQLLTRVLDEQQGGSYEFRKAQLLLARGRAKVRFGDDVGARADFSHAIGAIETQREEVSDLRLRSAFFGRADDAYEDLMALLVRSDEMGEALRVFDRSCERTLTEVVSSNNAAESLPRNNGVLRTPGDGNALVEITVLPDEVVAWTMRRSGVSISRHSVSSARVEELVELYERAIDTNSQTVQTIGSDLFDIVIRPLELSTESDKTVTFITHRLLRRVPMASLYDRARKRYLVEDFAVATAPSAAVYWFCSARRAGNGKTTEVVAIGNTKTAALALDLPDLPEAERELTHFASRSRGRLLLNERATPKAFLAEAAGNRIVYFAGHALVNEHDRGRSALVLAPEGAESSSALLHADRIATARLQAPLVVLSACTTNSVTRRAAEGAVDVAGAFLAAGVPTVVTSRWAIADDRARDLLTIFARELAESSPAEALRHSQLEMLRRRDTAQRAVRSWCAFEVVGSV